MSRISKYLLSIILSAGFLPATLRAQEPARTFHIPALYHVGFWIRDVAKSRAFYERFLGFDEPYVLNRASGVLQMVVVKVNDRQSVLIFPNPAKILPNGDNLDHLGLETDNVAALHDALAANGVKVGKVSKAHVGDLILGVKDPDGHTYEITQLEPDGWLMQHQGKSLPSTRISAHLRSASIAVADLKASLQFYCDILGFKEIRRDQGGAQGPAWVQIQVPDGTDFLELLPYERAPTSAPARAVPEFCLEVPDAENAATVLSERAKISGFPAPSAVESSADGRRQTSCVDPDGTRVVFAEATRPQ